MLTACALHEILHLQFLGKETQDNIVGLETCILDINDRVYSKTVAPDCILAYCLACKRRHVGFHKGNLLALLVKKEVLVCIGKGIYPVFTWSYTLDGEASTGIGT